MIQFWLVLFPVCLAFLRYVLQCCLSCFPKIYSSMLHALVSTDMFFNLACLGFQNHILQCCLSCFSQMSNPMLLSLLSTDSGSNVLTCFQKIYTLILFKLSTCTHCFTFCFLHVLIVSHFAFYRSPHITTYTRYYTSWLQERNLAWKISVKCWWNCWIDTTP